MNINDLSTQLLYTTVPIWGLLKDDRQVSGTGFIFSFLDSKHENQIIPLLITNYHVMENIKYGFMEFNIQKSGLPIKEKSARVDFDDSVIQKNKLGDLDLIAIPIASALNDMHSKGIEVFFRSIDPKIIPTEDQIQNFAAIEDITFIGYPSGLFDSYNKSAIIRKGITATPIWNDYNGKPTFLIDAGVFPGSSGSPVFIYNQGSYPSKNGIVIGNRILFVGIISGTIERNKETFLNLGVVIKSTAMIKELRTFIDSFLSH